MQSVAPNINFKPFQLIYDSENISNNVCSFIYPYGDVNLIFDFREESKNVMLHHKEVLTHARMNVFLFSSMKLYASFMKYKDELLDENVHWAVHKPCIKTPAKILTIETNAETLRVLMKMNTNPIEGNYPIIVYESSEASNLQKDKPVFIYTGLSGTLTEDLLYVLKHNPACRLVYVFNPNNSTFRGKTVTEQMEYLKHTIGKDKPVENKTMIMGLTYNEEIDIFNYVYHGNEHLSH